MKKFCTLIAALAVLVSCQKPQSEEEKKAEVEKQVQDRLAAEHQTDEQRRLAQQQADLEAREKALADKEAVAATVAPATVPETAPVETETVRRNRVTTETSERRSTASYGTFYRKLEPYGAWRETTDYGYVWQPREAEESRTWRPYTEGHWVYTDAGWTWVSEEPFGWATYHYGRWVRLRRVGWVWVPGEEWAPAWVSWRTSKDYVGWAPLPPEARFDRKHGIQNWADNYYDISPDQYAFVPGNEFGSRRIQSSVMPVERNVTIVIETTNVTNITYSNTMVVNEGPKYEEMRSRSQQPIERYRLQRQVEMNTDTAKPVIRGDVLEMSAPVITRVQGIDRPQTVKETLTQATVEKTWAADTDRSASERARAKMKAEVTPPPDAPSKTFVKPEAASSPAVTATVAATSSTPASTPTSAVSSTPIPSATARATAAAISTATPSATASPSPSASARPTATAAATASASPTATPAATPVPSVAASPSVTPRRPSPAHPPRPLPSITATPPEPALPDTTAPSPTPGAISTPFGSPNRPAQTPRSAARTVEAQQKFEEAQRAKGPPQPKPSPTAISDATPTPAPSIPRILPPRPATPRPSATVASETFAKPLPAYTPPAAPKAVTPPVTPSGLSATQLPSAPASDSPAKSPVAAPNPSPVVSPAESAKPDHRKLRRPGQVEGQDSTPTPTPTSTAAPN
jgi:hypothetical protein